MALALATELRRTGDSTSSMGPIFHLLAPHSPSSCLFSISGCMYAGQRVPQRGPRGRVRLARQYPQCHVVPLQPGLHGHPLRDRLSARTHAHTAQGRAYRGDTGHCLQTDSGGKIDEGARWWRHCTYRGWGGAGGWSIEIEGNGFGVVNRGGGRGRGRERRGGRGSRACNVARKFAGGKHGEASKAESPNALILCSRRLRALTRNQLLFLFSKPSRGRPGHYAGSTVRSDDTRKPTSPRLFETEPWKGLPQLVFFTAPSPPSAQWVRARATKTAPQQAISVRTAIVSRPRPQPRATASRAPARQDGQARTVNYTVRRRHAAGPERSGWRVEGGKEGGSGRNCSKMHGEHLLCPLTALA